MLNTMAKVDGSTISKDIDPLHPTISKGALASLKSTRNTNIRDLNPKQLKDGTLSTHRPLSLTKIIASSLNTTVILIHHTWTLSGME